MRVRASVLVLLVIATVQEMPFFDPRIIPRVRHDISNFVYTMIIALKRDYWDKNSD